MATKDDIAEIQGWNLGTLGRWEIATVPDPVSVSVFGKENALPLVLIVHQESSFILSMQILDQRENNNCADILVRAIKKHRALPEVLVTRDQSLAAELVPVAEILVIRIEVAKRQTAVPDVLRAMRRVIR